MCHASPSACDWQVGNDGLISIICIDPSKGTALSTLFFYSEQDPAELWSAELQSSLPSDIRVRIYPDFGDPADVEYVLCWQPKAGLLASFPNLKLILSLAAGSDHVLQIQLGRYMCPSCA